MKKLILFPSLAILAAAVVLVASCKKITDADEDAENAATTGQEMSIGLDATNAIFTVIDDLLANDARFQKTGTSILPPGATLTFIDSLPRQKDGDDMEYTLDFGPLPGLVCGDGITRAGKLMVTTDSTVTKTKAYTTVSTDSFFVKVGNVLAKVQIPTKSLVLNSNIIDKTTTILFSRATMSIVTPKNSFSLYSFGLISKRIEMGAPGIADDEIYTGCAGHGTNSKGKNFDFKTISDVVRVEKPNCSLPTKGIINIDSDGVKFDIDFDTDNAACDRKVKVKVAGVETTKTF